MPGAFRWAVVIGMAGTIGHAQEHQHASPEQLGRVHFATSCSAAAQQTFDRSIALLHSFDFGRAIDGFERTFTEDGSCAIAGWGIALSRWNNPFAAGVKPPAQVRLGRDAIQRARAAGAKTGREREYIDAAAKLFDDADRIDQPARVTAYRDAMAAVAARYPDDGEATIFYALALAFSADPADKRYAQQLKAGAMLERLFAAQPDHPGLAHYIIHTYDVPPLADRGLEAARRYARIAPSAPHALHMPSHTFTRVGYWQESIDTNIAAAKSAREAGATGEELHASDYQMYAFLQTAQDRAARQLLDSLPAMVDRYDPAGNNGAAPPAAAFFAIAAMPARYALERGAWREAASLTPRSSPFAFADAITHFARALGAARLGDASAAQAAVAKFGPLRETLAAAGEAYWAEQVAIQEQVASAWLALAAGRREAALTDMRAAADREDATEKNAVTPGPLAPARELLGDMLMELKAPDQALTAYEAVLKKEPNRFRAVYGAAHAGAALGNRAAARLHFRELIRICARAEAPPRRELAEARRFVSAR